MAAPTFRPKALLMLTTLVSAVLLYLFLSERKQRTAMEEREIVRSQRLDSANAQLELNNRLLTFDTLLILNGNTAAAERLLDSLSAAILRSNSPAFAVRKTLLLWANDVNAQPNGAVVEPTNFDNLELANAKLLIQRDSLLKVNSLLQANSRRDFETLSAELDRVRNDLRKHERVKVLSFPGQKGATVHYLGEVANGQANGGGIGIWTTGSVYRGEWKNNLRHGEGSFQWADGEKYIGAYVNGKREGMGVYLWPSGDKYDGEWKNDRRNGQGTLYDLDGRIVFSGLWVDDQPKN
jgi:hypothetical protein